jgi:hypothetical protein
MAPQTALNVFAAAALLSLIVIGIALHRRSLALAVAAAFTVVMAGGFTVSTLVLS